MRRIAAGTSVAGLGLMTGVGLFVCGSATLDLESRTILFLSGIVLFVIGGSGYAAMQSQAPAAGPEAEPRDERLRACR